MSSSISFEDVFGERFVPLDSRKRVGNFILGRIIGEGSFSQVRRGKHVQTGEPVAIKVLPKKTILKKQHARRRLLRETRALRKLRHPCIARLRDVMETFSNYYLVLDLIGGENFKDYISKRGSLTEGECTGLLYQLVSTVQVMHTHGIVHRDLKPDNFIKDGDRLIIVDFGLSGFIQHGDLLTTQCGSPAFTAPEVYSQQPYSYPVDIWSIGVILHIMLIGCLPFIADGSSHSKLLNVILQGYDPPRHLTADCRELLSWILQLEPEKRASLSDILEHPWVKSQQQTVN